MNSCATRGAISPPSIPATACYQRSYFERYSRFKRIQNPTARWVFHYFVGIHVLYVAQQGLIVLNLTEEHQHLLQLLGKRYVWFYR
jgi:hypothetical protein